MSRTEQVDRLLQESGYDGYLARDDSSNASLYYLTGFEASDPYIYLRADGDSILLVPQLELSRAKEEASVDRVLGSSRYVDGESRDDSDRLVQVLEKLLEEFDVETVAVPEDFPLGTADRLRERVEAVEPVEDPAMESRKVKDESEVQKLREAQQLTEEAMKETRSMLTRAETRDGELVLEGETLTSERLKAEVKKFLLERGAELPHGMIAAPGSQSARPHAEGSGPIEPGEPVVVDIYPRQEMYFGDMTRTFVRGEVPEEVAEMHRAVEEALEAALEVLEAGAGVKASEIHGAVCDVLEEHGYATLRQDGETESGFTHSTGHAVGLALHEPPRLADNDDTLEAGNVLTVEPGLYIPGTGGMRVEDMVLVTEEGYENFNSMERGLKGE